MAVKLVEPVVIAKETTIYDRIREALEESDGSAESAIQTLEMWAKEDQELLWDLFRAGLYELCMHQVRKRRRAVINQPARSGFQDTTERKAMAPGGAMSLLDMPIGSGELLGDMTGKALKEYATMLLKQSETLLWRGTWFMLVADKSPNKPIRESLTDKDLSRLRDEAKRLVAK